MAVSIHIESRFFVYPDMFVYPFNKAFQTEKGYESAIKYIVMTDGKVVHLPVTIRWFYS